MYESFKSHKYVASNCNTIVNGIEDKKENEDVHQDVHQDEENENSSKGNEKKRSEQTFWEKLGNPRHILAPMVDLSELPFRLLCKKYNCHLAFTPMLNAKIFVQCEKYRKSNFTTCDLDKPLIAQFCGNNYELILKAIEWIKKDVNAIDLNFGCPQQIAKKGNYGAFLLNQQNVIPNLVYNITNNTDTPVTCKIRKIDQKDYQKTLNLCYDLEQRNVKMITIHGRTKEEKGRNIKECDYELIKIIKERINLPIVANGSIEFFEDIQKCLNYTKADAVMCAEIILEQPHFFSNSKTINTIDIVNEYYSLFLKYETNLKYLKGHLFKMLYKYFVVNTSLRDQLNECHSLENYKDFLKILNQKKEQGLLEEAPPSCSWYRRYRKVL